jgi:membrane protease YdiL (CAAX protease family)
MNLYRQLATVTAAPLWFRLLTVTRAAVVEETAFRGYGIERLREWTGSLLLAGLVTWILFTLAHLSSWGWGQVIIAAYGGFILTGLYLWRRNLWANMICHWLTDGSAFILLPLIAHHH